jgi:hypothetical protein
MAFFLSKSAVGQKSPAPRAGQHCQHDLGAEKSVEASGSNPPSLSSECRHTRVGYVRLYRRNGKAKVQTRDIVHLARQAAGALLPAILVALLLSATVSTAAVQEGRPNTVTITDARHRRVEIALPLERIVTINTSSAVILRALGVDVREKVVGVTSYITSNPEFWPELKDKPDFPFTRLNYTDAVKNN